MNKMKLNLIISNWSELHSFMEAHYKNSHILIHDDTESFFDVDDELMEIGYFITDSTIFYEFESFEETKSFLENSMLDIVGGYTNLFVNGHQDNSLIYMLRG